MTSHAKYLCFLLCDQMHQCMIQVLEALKVKHAVGLPDCAKVAVNEDGVICEPEIAETYGIFWTLHLI